jgi:hypothetical protein
MVDDSGASGQGGPPDPPARRPGDASGFGEPAGRTPETIGPKARASVLRQPTIAVEPSSVRAAPGSPATLVIGVTNNSDTVEEFTVELDDRSVGWIRIEPATKNLFPGTRDVFRVVVDPPRSASVRAGLKQYGLTIRSTGIPNGTASVTVSVEVLPFEAVEPRLVPRASSGYRTGRHRIEIRNDGSALWAAAVSATDPQDVLRITVPPNIGVGPGETINVPVVVKPRPWNIVGKAESRPFTVVLDAAGNRRQLDGSMDQQPFIPAALIPLLAGLAVAAVAVVLFAAGIIPPKAAAEATPGPTTAIVSEAPSAVPSAPSSEAVSAPASAEVSAPPSEVPSVSAPPSTDPSAAPDGVDQWAWDRKIKLMTQGSPFDVGKPIGDTQDTSDGRARVQWFEQAVMYQFQDKTVQVVRPPILAAFPLQPISKDPPTTGYPTDSRKGAGGNLIYQPFDTDTILCADTSCVVYPRNVIQEWLADQAKLGAPTGPGVSPGGAMTVYPFAQGHIVWDPTRFFVSACDANNVYISGDTDLCASA